MLLKEKKNIYFSWSRSLFLCGKIVAKLCKVRYGSTQIDAVRFIVIEIEVKRRL